MRRYHSWRTTAVVFITVSALFAFQPKKVQYRYCCLAQQQQQQQGGQQPLFRGGFHASDYYSSSYYYTAMDHGDRLVRIDAKAGGKVTAVEEETTDNTTFCSHHGGVTGLDYHAASKSIFALLDGKILVRMRQQQDDEERTARMRKLRKQRGVRGGGGRLRQQKRDGEEGTISDPTMEVVGKTGLRKLRGLAIKPASTSAEGDGGGPILYTYASGNNVLYSLDPTAMMGSSPPAKKVFDTGIPGIVDLAYSLQRQKLYAADGENRLFSIDLSRRTRQSMGTIKGLDEQERVSGIVFSCDGLLHALTTTTTTTTRDDENAKRSKIVQISLPSLEAKQVSVLLMDHTNASTSMRGSKPMGFTVQCVAPKTEKVLFSAPPAL